MLKKMLMLAAVLLTTATGAAGQECTAGYEDGIGCFEMWNGCRNMTSFVYVNGNAIGLRADVIQNTVESRLRAAGFDPDSSGVGNGRLYLRVLLHRGAFNIRLDFVKGWMRDDYGFEGRAQTWELDFFGTHGDSSSYVMEQVREALDEFMNHYLRVNEPACRQR